MSGSVREALPDVWELSKAYLDVLEWSGDPLGCPGVVGLPSQMFGSGCESLPDVREWSGDPPGCPGVVGSPTGCPRVVERQFRMSMSGQEALPDVRELLEAFLDVLEWSGDPPG